MPKQQIFSATDVERAKAALSGLPRKPRAKPDHLLMPDLIKQMRAEIRAALNRGYSLEDVVTALNQQGFDLKTPTVKRYFYANRGVKRAKKVTPKAQFVAPKKEPHRPNSATQSGAQKRQPSEKPGAGVPPVMMPKADEL